jgi:hypothetical protein
MIRSYALTAAAITLRIYPPLVFVSHWPLAIGYPAIEWLCWIPNVIAVELYLHLVPTPSGISVPQAGVPAKGVEFSARCEAVRSV